MERHLSRAFIFACYIARRMSSKMLPSVQRLVYDDLYELETAKSIQLRSRDGSGGPHHESHGFRSQPLHHQRSDHA